MGHSLTAPQQVSVALHAALRSRFQLARRPNLALDLVLLVLPPLLAVTQWADTPGTLSLLLLIPTGLLVLLPARESGTPLPSNSFTGESQQDNATLESERTQYFAEAGVIRPLPAASTWRAHMMLMTVLCILAVDFPVFPRALAKCETYGVSLVSQMMLVLLAFSNRSVLDGPWRRLVRLCPRLYLCTSHLKGSFLPVRACCSEDNSFDAQMSSHPHPRSCTGYPCERVRLSRTSCIRPS